MSHLLQRINSMNQMLLEGKALEALEDFYAENAVMQENDQAPTVGKAANRLREQEFYAAITEFRDVKVISVAANQNKTYVEWFYDYTHRDWGKKRYHQVSVQTWEGDKIVHERFYYGS